MRMRVKYVWQLLGGHVHVTMFSNIVPDFEKKYTLANAGNFILSEKEFKLWSVNTELATKQIPPSIEELRVEFEAKSAG